MNDLKENPFAKWSDKADFLVPNAVLQMYEGIKEDEEAPSTNVARCSSATSDGSGCVKQRQYQRQGVKGEPMAPRAHILFATGDCVELVIKHFIEKYNTGPGKLYSEVNFGEVETTFLLNRRMVSTHKQLEWSGDMAGIKVTGHPDGVGKRNIDGKWELIEIKSASNWGFKSFMQDEECSYLPQVHALMMTKEAKKLGIKSARFFYQRKETGHPWDRLYKFDEKIAQQVINNFLKSSKDDYIAPPYKLVDETYYRKPTGRKIAKYPCSYCSFKKQCLGEFEIDWKPDQHGHKKPVHVFKGGK